MNKLTEPEIRLGPAEPAELAAYEALYSDSFPENERKPFPLLQLRAAEGKAEMLSIRSGETFIGLVVTMLYGRYALIDYLVVCPEARNRGIGARVLGLIRSRYPDRLVFLEIEDPKTELQSRRRAFYIRNGILPTGLAVRNFGEDMLILSDGGAPVPYEDYETLLARTAGEYILGNVSFRGFTPQE